LVGSLSRRWQLSLSLDWLASSEGSLLYERFLSQRSLPFPKIHLQNHLGDESFLSAGIRWSRPGRRSSRITLERLEVLRHPAEQIDQQGIAEVDVLGLGEVIAEAR